MKNLIKMTVALLFATIALAGCSQEINDDSSNEPRTSLGTQSDVAAPGDYRPMVFIQDILYGETFDVVHLNELPDNAQLIGSIETVVPQNAPMVRENNTSNVLKADSEVFADPSDSSKIYVQLPDGRYSVYEEIE